MNYIDPTGHERAMMSGENVNALGAWWEWNPALKANVWKVMAALYGTAFLGAIVLELGAAALAITEGAIAAQSISAASLAGGRVLDSTCKIWTQGIGPRGRIIEEMLMEKVPGWFGYGNNVRVIDGWNAATETAYSVKSIDLAGKSVEYVTSTIRDAAAALSQYAAGRTVTTADGQKILVSAIKDRVLQVGIPDMKLPPEMAKALSDLVDLARGMNVELIYTAIK